MSEKIIQDAVHGYITVPKNYLDHIVDTKFFQRLRRISQSSVRALYPCATHDRFTHSLGVYHLACKAFSYIKKSSETFLSEKIYNDDWNCIKSSFEMACLLHDCGHAPFSHTFENYYDREENLSVRLLESFGEEFKSDFGSCANPKPHEMVSAILVNSSLRDNIKECASNADVELIARMIIGCKFLKDNPLSKVKNCFISLLNGESFDLDKLDYSLRDSWASGAYTSRIDVERIISSLSIKKVHDAGVDSFEICFRKNALSAIQNMFDVVDFQNLWMIPHHKTVYENFILTEAVTCFAKSIYGDEKHAMSKIFNIESFYEEIICGQYKLYMPTDDDIVHVLKNYQNNDYAKEWFSRDHRLKPIWKSYAELMSFFHGYKIENFHKNSQFNKKIRETIDNFEAQKNIFGEALVIDNCIKATKNYNGIYISFGDRADQIIKYNSLRLPAKNFHEINFPYVYLGDSLRRHKDELIEKIKETLEV